MSVTLDLPYTTIFLYLIVIIFNQGIEKNGPSERFCQTESTLWSVSNNMGGEFR